MVGDMDRGSTCCLFSDRARKPYWRNVTAVGASLTFGHREHEVLAGVRVAAHRGVVGI